MMQWYKMDSNWPSDGKVVDALSLVGHRGMYIWHVLLASLARQKNGEPIQNFTISARRLREDARVTARTLDEVLANLARAFNFSYTKTAQTYSFDYPKFMKLQNKYFKKTRISAQNQRTNGGGEKIRRDKKRKEKIYNVHPSDERVSLDVKNKTMTLSSINEQFNKLWSRYPRKEGKRSAERSYGSLLKKGITDDQMHKALDNYKRHIEKNKVEDKFIKMGSTWFNNLEDWIDYKVEPTFRYY